MQDIQASRRTYESVKKHIQDNKSVLLSPEGTSMYPFLQQGKHKVLIAPLAQKKLHVGDIILYRRENELLVLHRICKITKEGYFFAGDNQTELEGPVDREQMIAIVKRIYRKGYSYSVKNPIYYVLSRSWLLIRPLRPYINPPVKKILKLLHIIK